MVNDLFSREEEVLKQGEKYLQSVTDEAVTAEYAKLLKEYGRVLKQLRRVTKISDRTTGELNNNKLDLIDKVQFDPLTGIYNRRYMETALKKILLALAANSEDLCIMMLDIDFFKKYNDTYGHQEGDECLRQVAQSISKSIRKDDFVARYGGEEFIVVLPKANDSGARLVAEKILTGIRSLKIPHKASEVADYVTISIGIVQDKVTDPNVVSTYIKTADSALYVSKNSGRNRFTFKNLKGEDKI